MGGYKQNVRKQDVMRRYKIMRGYKIECEDTTQKVKIQYRT